MASVPPGDRLHGAQHGQWTMRAVFSPPMPALLPPPRAPPPGLPHTTLRAGLMFGNEPSDLLTAHGLQDKNRHKRGVLSLNSQGKYNKSRPPRQLGPSAHLYSVPHCKNMTLDNKRAGTKDSDTVLRPEIIAALFKKGGKSSFIIF